MAKAIGACWLGMVVAAGAVERPNIVFLLSDDHDWKKYEGAGMDGPG